MKQKFGILLITTVFFLSACAAQTSVATPLPESSTATTPPQVEATQPPTESSPEVQDTASATVPTDTPAATDSINLIPPTTESNSQNPQSYTVTLNDNGKTFNLNIGDSLLLNLGADMYDWQAEVDNQSVLRLKMGVMVIRGAQGLYDAVGRGNATLSATGNPFCLTSTPACAMPSLLFSVTVNVQ